MKHLAEDSCIECGRCGELGVRAYHMAEQSIEVLCERCVLEELVVYECGCCGGLYSMSHYTVNKSGQVQGVCSECRGSGR